MVEISPPLMWPAPLPRAMGWFGGKALSEQLGVPALAGLVEVLGEAYAQVASADQVHGVRAVRVDGPGEVPACDALWTTVPGLCLAIKTADCVPLLGSFALPDGTRGLLAVHAGWPGAAKGIVPGLLRQLREDFGVEMRDVQLRLGPSISQANYQVQDDVAQQAPEACLMRNADGSFQLDVPGWVTQQAVEAGVPVENISAAGVCTYAAAEDFYSWRRYCHTGKTGVNGRNWSLVGLT